MPVSFLSNHLLGFWIWSLFTPVTAAQVNLADDNYIAVKKMDDMDISMRKVYCKSIINI